MLEPPADARASRPAEIHYARNWTVSLKSKYQLLNVRLGLYTLALFVGIATFAVPNPLTRTFGQAYVALAMGVLTILCPMLFEMRNLRRWRARRRDVERAPIAAEPDQNARIRCVGLPEEFDALGELHDVHFDPQLFFGGLCVPLDRYTSLRCVVVSGIVLILIAIFRIGSGSYPGGFWLAAISSLLPAGIVGWILTVVIWPAYVRIVPGRLDTLEFGPLRSEPRRVRSYNLKDRTVTVDMNRRLIVLGRHAKDEFAFGLMPDGRRVAYYTLLAAISTHVPGPLPRGELVG